MSSSQLTKSYFKRGGSTTHQISKTYPISMVFIVSMPVDDSLPPLKEVPPWEPFEIPEVGRKLLVSACSGTVEPSGVFPVVDFNSVFAHAQPASGQEEDDSTESACELSADQALHLCHQPRAGLAFPSGERFRDSPWE